MRAGLLVIAVILLIGVLALYFVVPQMRAAEAKDAAQSLVSGADSANGAIRGWNEKNALEVTITPTLQSGKASWACKGYPVDAMPTTCGGRS